MRNKTPHLIILSFLFTAAHYTQVGAEMIARALPEQAAAFGVVSSIAVAASMWLVTVAIVPWTCRKVLAVYAVAGRVTDASCAWTKAKLVELIKKLLDRLNQ